MMRDEDGTHDPTEERQRLLQSAIKDLKIGHESMKTLRLSHHDLDANDMTLLGPALTENVVLIELDLRGNRLKDEGATRLARAIAGCGTLAKLLVGRNYIGCKGAAQLMTGNRLRTLMLEENSVNESDDGLSSRWWNYGKGDVIDGAVSDSMYQVGQALGGHPWIEHISLAGNKIGDEAVIRLAHGVADSRSLLVLDLSNNILTDKGAAALARAMKRNKGVLDLNLNNNRVGNTGASLLRQVLVQNKDFYHLDLGQNKMDKEMTQLLRKKERSNREKAMQAKWVRPKRSERESHRPLVTKQEGKKVPNMMDDMVRDYLREETKDPSFALKEDREPEPERRAYIPLAADKHQKHNFYENGKQGAKANYGTAETGYMNEGEMDGMGRKVFKEGKGGKSEDGKPKTHHANSALARQAKAENDIRNGKAKKKELEGTILEHMPVSHPGKAKGAKRLF
jgi:hypothetical protein